MTARGLRYLYLSALRTRAPVLELVALALTVLEFFADTKAEVGSTWALTALLGGALAAWLVGAMLAGEADPQADMVAPALGGRLGRLRLYALLVAVVATLVSACFIGYPLLLTVAGRDVFQRRPAPPTSWPRSSPSSRAACSAARSGSASPRPAWTAGRPPRSRRWRLCWR